MPRSNSNPSPPFAAAYGHHVWPELMDAATASRFVGEKSRRTFLRRVGRVYPRPHRIPGRGDVWPKVDLQAYVATIRGEAAGADLADVL
jgi:hypothetical protein